MILDRNMNFLKKIKVFEGICIYNSFVTGKNEFVLFCPDENKMVYINIENEKVSPTMAELEAIAKALDVRITDLFDSDYK